ncbi:hypothetical protein, partial [Pontibacter brevis]
MEKAVSELLEKLLLRQLRQDKLWKEMYSIIEAISKIPKHYLHAREQQECQVIISLLFLSDQGSS